MKRSLITLLAAAAVLAACSKTESVLPSGSVSGPVRFTTDINTYSVKATDTAFEDNDQVGIFAGAPISVSNVKASVSGSALTPETAISWVPGSTATVSFFAYYPYAEGAVQAYPFAVAANQSAIADFKKSDLMIAKASSAPTTEAVALKFNHALSKVVFALDNQLSGVSVTKLEFINVALGAVIDLQTGAVTPSNETLKTVVANKTAENAYQLLIVPQTAKPTVKITLSNGEAYLYELAAEFAFKAGKKASANLVVKQPSDEQEVLFSFEIVDWEADETELAYGEPVPATPDDVVWSVVGLGDKWDVDIPMECTISGENPGEGTFEADITFGFGDAFKLRQNKSWDLSAGLKEGWTYYGTGEFEDGYLDTREGAGDITLQVCGEMHLKFEYPSCRFIITEKGESTANKGHLTVYVDDQSGWEALNLYVWTAEGNILGDWPGTAAPAETETVGDVVYKKWAIEQELSPRGIHYILNNGNGVQTADLDTKLTSVDTKLFVKLKDDATVEVVTPAE